jgi:4-diphosphocytidyl-2-C-methyl-D-erythritol kinase
MVVEKALAKINLALDVIGKREDRYHDLHMVMTTVDLFDRLSFEKLQNDEIKLSCDKPYVPLDERNFVHKAIQLIKTKYQIKEGVSVNIQKHIPVSAGLAGGSSDAAAAIRAMNQLFNLNMSLEDMIEIGKAVGSDVPFCIYNKTAIAEGRGEILTPLPKPPKCWVVLIKPHFGVSTKEVFQNVVMDKIHHPNVSEVISAVKTSNYKKLIESVGNSLEDVTFELYPEVEELKKQIQRLNPDVTLMSGSGPTIFALALKERNAKRIINSMDKRLYETFAVRILG